MIAIICAIDAELTTILSKVTIDKRSNIAGVEIFEAQYQDKKLVIAKSGVGKIEATKTTMLLIYNYQIDYIINIGTAGSINSEIHLFDLVLADTIYEYDFDTSYVDGDSFVYHEVSTDTSLNHLASQTIKFLKFEDMICGDSFIADKLVIQKLKSKFPTAVACDMESFAIIKIARDFNIPAMCLRSISDETELVESELSFLKYAQAAADRSSEAILKIINQL